MPADQYIRILVQALESLAARQLHQIRDAGEILARAIAGGRGIFSFGASHSFMMTEEMVYRAGGLVPVNPIFPQGMHLGVRPLTLTSRIERQPGLGKELLAASPARAGDVLILTSHSGRNPVAIDMAVHAREQGMTTLAILSLSHATCAASRHPSGKKLHSLVDLVIDNGAPAGDAALEVPGCRSKVGPLSSVVGCAIVNAIVIETVEQLVARGIEPPVFASANVDGGDEYNARLLRENRHRIYYL